MIIIDMQLWSAVTFKTNSLGIIVLDNQGQTAGRKTLATYRARAFAKGTPIEDIVRGKAKPIREGKVVDHAKNSKPVWNLMFKALVALGYGK